MLEDRFAFERVLDEVVIFEADYQSLGAFAILVSIF